MLFRFVPVPCRTSFCNGPGGARVMICEIMLSPDNHEVKWLRPVLAQQKIV